MTGLLVVGGIAAAHRVARDLGAELTLVRYPAAQTMLGEDDYRRVVDLSAAGDDDPGVLARTACAQLAGEEFDGMLCLHDDAVRLGARVAALLGVPFHPPDVADRTVSKLLMRERLAGTGLGTVAHGLVRPGGDIDWRTPPAAGPVVLKPVDGRASRDVSFFDGTEALTAYLSRHAPRCSGFLVEERKLGREYSIESLRTRAGSSWQGITEKTTREAVESGHVHPAPLAPDHRRTLLRLTDEVLDALGMETGLFHTEAILDASGRAHVVETHLRGGGDLILDLVRLTSGWDLTEMMVRDLLGAAVGTPSGEPTAPYASSQFLFPPRTGVIERCEGLDRAARMPGVVEVQLLQRPGDTVRADCRSSFGRVAVAVATADTPGAAGLRARRALAQLDLVVREAR